MRKSNQNTVQILLSILAGLLIFFVSLAVSVGVAQAQEGTPTPEATQPPKACAECHPNVQDHWKDSPHAHAFDNPEFTARWQASGSQSECLLCHTTGYQANSGEYTAEGVTCEACHGQAQGQHPPAVIPVKADTEYCGSCHTTTLGEWRLTGHSAAGVGCTDCHNPHNQKALFENPDELCLNCHKDDLGEHQNDLHLEKGITCVQCHALTLPPAQPPADGLVPTGHTFTIHADTCVACHTDVFKAGTPLPGYEAGAKAVAAGETISPTLPGLVNQYTSGHPQIQAGAAQQLQALQASIASTRMSTLFQGGIIGLVLGGTTAYFMAHNRRKDELELDDSDDDSLTQAGEHGQD